MKQIAHVGRRFGKHFVIMLGFCAGIYLIMILFSFGVSKIPGPSTLLAMQGQGSTSLLDAAPTLVPTPGPTPGSTSSPGPGPTPTPAQDQNPAQDPNCTVGTGPLNFDLCTHFSAVVQHALIDPVVFGALKLFNDSVDSIISTNAFATYTNPDMKDLHQTLLLATDAFLLLVILATGIRMVYEQSAVSWAAIRETIPQVLLAFLLAQFSLDLVALIIQLNNALCSVVMGPGQLALGNLLPANTAPLDLFAAFLRFVLAIFLVLLVLEAAVRLPIINVCLVLASAGCFALAWRPTQRLGFFWLNTFLVAVLTQCLQLLCLVIGMLMVRGLQSQQNTYITLIGGIAIAFAALALPFYVYRWAIQPVMTAGQTVIGVAGQQVERVTDAARILAMAA